MKKALFLFTLVFGLIFSTNTSYANTYDDAKILGDKLANELIIFESTISSGDIQSINDEYDEFTNLIKKEERAIGKVQGKSNRDKLNTKYVRPAKIAKERVIYEVSQYRLIKIIEGLLESENYVKVKLEMAKLDRLKKRAVEIKKAGGYKQLPSQINEDLESLTENILVIYEEATLPLPDYLETEPNNKLDSIQEIPTNIKLIGEFKDKDLDIFSFEVNAGSTLKFKLTQEYPLSSVVLFNPDQELMGYIYNASKDTTMSKFENLEAGTYYLQIMKGSIMIAPTYSYSLEIRERSN